MQTKLVQATDPRIQNLEKEPLERAIRELEGEVQVLSMREKDYRTALINKEQELQKALKRKLVVDKEV